PIAPPSTSVTGLTTVREIHRGAGRQLSRCRRALVQATESRAKEMIRTSEAPQANNQAGTGRSFLPTRAWADASSGKASAAAHPPATRAARRVARCLRWIALPGAITG